MELGPNLKLYGNNTDWPVTRLSVDRIYGKSQAAFCVRVTTASPFGEE